MSESNSYNSYSSNNEDSDPCCSTNIDVQSQVECLENTEVMTDDFSLVDVLLKFKAQVKALAEILNGLDQQLSLNKSPTNANTHQELLKIKKNIINDITCLLKETRPLNYPSFQSLTSVKLLKLYEKVSAESVLLLNSIKHDDKNMIKNIDRFKELSIFIKDLLQEIDNYTTQNTINADIEEKVAQDFKECKSDMYLLLSQLSPSSTLKETLSWSLWIKIPKMLG
ncbi:uncharacterized protein LOC112691273 isoform X2 [Sipha flava]|uniref:Uncharacterized protein LOC112691273 isoform X2 n=1 Tax=Sipha flava TaxID=143950 RepID=A0A8B8GE58_9HEMI|nr:uncharacterized protein LOC112691273 isoform X2 [Sipha flava]